MPRLDIAIQIKIFLRYLYFPIERTSLFLVKIKAGYEQNEKKLKLQGP